MILDQISEEDSKIWLRVIESDVWDVGWRIDEVRTKKIAFMGGTKWHVTLSKKSQVIVTH